MSASGLLALIISAVGMAWSPFGRQNAMDSVSQADAIINERTVETAAIPTTRFVKKGSAEGSCVLTAASTDRPIGVSREGNGPRADITAGTFTSYAVGDKAQVVERTTGHVYVELTDQTITSIADGSKWAPDAAGKAKAAATNDIVAGFAAKVNALVTDRSGVKYVRLIPNWMTKEVAP